MSPNPRLRALRSLLWSRFTEIGGGRCYIKANLDDLAVEILRAIDDAQAAPEAPVSPDNSADYHRGIYKSRCCSTLKANPYIFDSCPTCGRNLGWEHAARPVRPEPHPTEETQMERELPRRCYLDLQTPAEAAIRAAIDAVEALPADVRAVTLLGDALGCVADFVDGIPPEDAVCEHGTAMDVHCCNCHGGFLFDSASCVCEFDAASPADPSGEAP
jgi:hypothetical protein